VPTRSTTKNVGVRQKPKVQSKNIINWEKKGKNEPVFKLFAVPSEVEKLLHCLILKDETGKKVSQRKHTIPSG